jgi:hypothetical protein
MVFCGRSSIGEFGLVDAMVGRTEMYIPSVRFWYECYFLSRRTVLIALSVLLSKSAEKRTVSPRHDLARCFFCFE